jgi:hypothetical protein
VTLDFETLGRVISFSGTTGIQGVYQAFGPLKIKPAKRLIGRVHTFRRAIELVERVLVFSGMEECVDELRRLWKAVRAQIVYLHTTLGCRVPMITPPVHPTELVGGIRGEFARGVMHGCFGTVANGAFLPDSGKPPIPVDTKDILRITTDYEVSATPGAQAREQAVAAVAIVLTKWSENDFNFNGGPRSAATAAMLLASSMISHRRRCDPPPDPPAEVPWGDELERRLHTRYCEVPVPLDERTAFVRKRACVMCVKALSNYHTRIARHVFKLWRMFDEMSTMLYYARSVKHAFWRWRMLDGVTRGPPSSEIVLPRGPMLNRALSRLIRWIAGECQHVYSAADEERQRVMLMRLLHVAP